MTFEKFKILLWKNWIITKTHWKSGLFEVLLPLAFIFLLIFLRSRIPGDGINQATVIALPMIIVFSVFFSVGNLINSVAVERESQLKELMKIMGLSSFLHWSSWFILVFIKLLISFTLVVILLKFDVVNQDPMFGMSNFFIVWIFFVIYITAVISLCFFIGAVFKKPTTATNIGVMLFFATIIPYFQFTQYFSSLHYSVKFLFCLPINTGLGEGIALILRFEMGGDGIQFSNFFTRDDTGFSFAEIILVMVVAIFIHIGLLIYVENVFPGGTGNAKPWHFPFSSCFKRENEKIKLVDSVTTTSNDDYESEPLGSAGIQIKNLCKSFGSFNAVNNLSLNIFEDQITILLGFNGSGKTTSMNIMTGMLPPTSGTAIIDGKDIRTQTDEARRSLGLCPQKDVLFSDLTVREHIIFFCRLKGMKVNREIEAEVEKYTKALNLEDKLNERSKTLSGGMKRKLNTITALCGGSKIVICDEPSSGIDAGARRDLWDLLIQEKRGRTILLTTHHMDEAEVLGDRVAILNEGTLQTVGSTYFLKKKFGSGYRLTCVKKLGCDSRVILDILQSFAPDAKLISDDQTEIVFILLEKDISTFENIFKTLEDDSDKLKISSFGLSITTLEDVFLRIGRETSTARNNQNQFMVETNFDPTSEVKGITKFFYQIWAMTLKHIFFLRRNYQLFIWLILLSAWFVFISMNSYTPPSDEVGNFGEVIAILSLFFFALSYWSTLCVNLKIKERNTGANLLQFICGANRIIYWITSFILDWIIFISALLIILGVIVAFQLDNFSTLEQLGPLIIILTGYTFAALPAVYLVSRFFEKPGKGEEIIPLIVIICAAFYSAYVFLRFGDKIANIFADILFWIGLFIPPYSVVNCFHKYFTNAISETLPNILTFDEDGVGINLAFYVLTGIIFLSINILLDYGIINKIRYILMKNRKHNLKPVNNLDDDVQAEVDKVRSLAPSAISKRNLVLQGLTKLYKKLVAVNQIYLDVEPSQCFGLLGVNGAGKTSTFKMMVGDEVITSGDAFMRGMSLKNQIDSNYKSYCPQFDALLLDLTGRETLRIFCLLRGIKTSDINFVINKVSIDLDFNEHLDKRCKNMSGGNKRKLSTAIALLGDPSLIFLDEPTTGMDPMAKRKLWDVVTAKRNSGKSIVLTSHSIEEAEALCTRLAIMVAGEFKCLGSVQHLKNKFAKGFVLTIKMNHDDDALLATIDARVKNDFPAAKLKERYLKLLTFHLTGELMWSRAFGLMTKMKTEMEISDFILSQMSLEQVFLFLSKEGNK